MKHPNVAMSIITSALLLSAACASISPPGSQMAALHVAECMEWPVTAASVRGMIAEEDGVYTALVDPTAGTLSVTYDPVKTSPEKLAKKIRDRGYTVDWIKQIK